MAIEKDVIVGELKSKGISENLANGLSFETAEDLSSWVEAYTTSLPKTKEIQDYTKEEIEEMAKDPQFKGAKGLQGFFDAFRQKKTDGKNDPPKPNDPPTDLAALIAEANAPIMAQLEALKAQKEVESFETTLRKVAKSSGITDEELILDIKDSLSSKSTEAEIKAKIDKKKAYLAKLGIKQFGTPGSGGQDNSGSLKKAMEEWTKKQETRKKK